MLIDPKAVLFLLGSQMDFKVDRLSATFAFSNPNETSACGCGESVAIGRPARGASRAGLIYSTRMDAEALKALFEPFGPVIVKRMFGGSGVYAEGMCFAIEADGEVFLKTDSLSRPDFWAAIPPLHLYGEGQVETDVLLEFADSCA